MNNEGSPNCNPFRNRYKYQNRTFRLCLLNFFHFSSRILENSVRECTSSIHLMRDSHRDLFACLVSNYICFPVDSHNYWIVVYWWYILWLFFFFLCSYLIFVSYFVLKRAKILFIHIVSMCKLTDTLFFFNNFINIFFYNFNRNIKSSHVYLNSTQYVGNSLDPGYSIYR